MRMSGHEEKEKWEKNYSSNHQILLVGEGDFSFSFSLALSFASASNILASSLDSYDVVVKKYKKAKSNLKGLAMLGASILHGVDATKMKLHPDLMMRKFDRIIFNFPHAGFYGKEDNVQLIEMHRKLVRGFFRSASSMLRAEGEIHVNHKTSSPYCYWNIEELAWQSSLTLLECVKFRKEDYPGYNNKRGDGKRCDDPFHLGECSTFKFILTVVASKRFTLLSHTDFTYKRTRHFQNDAIEQCIYRPTLLDQGYPQRSIGLTLIDQVYLQTSFGLNTSWFPLPRSVQPSISIRSGISNRDSDHAFEIYGHGADVGKFSSFESRRYDYERHMMEAQGMAQQVRACPFKVNHREGKIDSENFPAFPLNMEFSSYTGAPYTFANRAYYNHPMVTQNRADDIFGRWASDSRMDDFVRCKMEVPSRNLHLSHLKYALDGGFD